MLNITNEQLKNYSVNAVGLKDGPRRVAVSAIKKYLYSVTGVNVGEEAKQFSISVVVDASLDTPHTDGFKISAQDKNVTITAKTQRAAVYAAFAFAEECLGVRFLTKDCEIIPKKESFTVKEYSYEPLFDMRTYLVGDTFQDLSDQDFMAKVRVKDLFTEADEDHGGRTEVYGRNVCHNFHYYVPYEKYGKTHPEFYRHIVVNDEEMTTIDITNGLNDDGTLNEAMPESVVKSVIEEMYADVKAFPDVKVFSLTQEDGADYFDDENNRRLEQKYKRSGLLVRFCNAVVRGVNERAKKELGRTVKIMTFAYHYTKDAPVKYENGEILPIDDTVVADENLVIQFALFSNAAYDYFSKYQDEGISKNMREWRVIAKEFWFWAYDIAFNNFFAFYDSFKNIDANLKGFKDYGITYMCMQGSNDSAKSWQCNARAYAYRQIMNGSKLTARELLDEYLDGYYSVAADEVREVIGLFSDNYAEKLRRGEKINFTTFGNFSNGENNPYDLLVNALKVLETAENKISEKYDGAEKERYLKRIAGVKVTPLDLMYLNYYYYFPNGNEEARANFRERFVETARYAGIDRARERYSLDRYVAFTESEVNEKKEPQPSAESPCE